MNTTNNNEMGLEVKLQVTQQEAIQHVTAALKEEGFGVLSKIDIDRAFKDKIGADFRPYTILGACNPGLAHAALTSKPEIGLFLPCNVTVEADGDNHSLVRFMNPMVMMQIGDLGTDETVRVVAQEATEKLKRVAGSLTNFNSAQGGMVN